MASKIHKKPGSTSASKSSRPTDSAATNAKLVAPTATEVEAVPTIVRFSLNLTQESADILRSTAARKGINVTDSVRRAISIMAVLDGELDRGHEIQTVDSKGKATRFVFL